MYLLLHRANNRIEFRVRPDAGAEQTAMVINTAGRVGIGTTSPQQVLSIGGGLNIDQNNLNTGTSANILSFGGSSGEGIGSKRNAGTGQFGLDFYTANGLRMMIANNGNVGIGTNNPQALLDLSVGNNRSFRFKNDLVPTIEISSTNAGDGLAGTMRLRNAMEIFPSSDGTKAGKLDVRNAASNATITLNGATGIVEANSINASSINVTSVIASGGVAAQSLYAPNMPAFGEKRDELWKAVLMNGGNLNAIMMDATVEVPAAGIILIKSSVDGSFDYVQPPPGQPDGTYEFKLDQYSAGGAYMTTLYKLKPFAFLSNPTIEYQLAVGGPGTFRFKYIIDAQNAPIISVIFGRPAMKFLFIPNALNVQ